MEYQEEGIPWSHIDFQDNAAVLGMIEEPRRGLLSLLDEECMLPQGTDEAYASKAIKVPARLAVGVLLALVSLAV